MFAFSEDFIVFEKDGYFGVKDGAGQVTVPPVYEKLGWSSGNNEVFEGLIGYKKGNSWGLITVRNKSITDQKFYSLAPFKEGYIKGSIKGKFSNHLFYGLLDTKGKTVVSFNYFELLSLDKELLVSEFRDGKQSFGMVSMQNEILIPLKYAQISREKDFFLGKTTKHTLDVYYKSALVQESLDSIKYSDGLIGYRAGYAGYINRLGRQILEFRFKSIEIENGETKITEFPTWKVYDNSTFEFEWNCDSIRYSENGIWIAHLNGAQHIVLPASETFDSKEYLIEKIENNFIIVKHSKTQKFSVIDLRGKELIADYDSIVFSKTHFLGLEQGKWDIINFAGSKLHKFSYDKIIAGPKNFFIAHRNNHWGVIDFNGDEYITFKYDSIIYTPNHYQVKYFNKWGILDFHGNWIVHPDYAKVQSFGEVVVARKGLGFSIFHNHQFKFISTNKPLYSLNENILVEGDSGKVGMLNKYGKIIADPIYDEILAWGEFIELRSQGYSKLISNSGQVIFDVKDEIQEVGGFSEAYFSIRKDNRWGFVDTSGKLRISNRYDSVYLFNDELAAIKLRGKWGFINKEESIVIQPYYDHVSAFHDGLAIVKSKNLSGIINKSGELVVEISFREIKRLSSGNYSVLDQNGRFGLINSNGSFLIRPSYEILDDTSLGIIVMRNNKWGLLDYNGNQLFKLEFSFLKVVENFVLLKI
jgi:hypothetical protein